MYSPGRPEGNPAEPLVFMERFYETPFLDEETQENSAEKELVTTFYKSMVGYVVDSVEPLSPPTETENPEKSIDGQNGDRITFKSGNVFEGQVVEWMPHGAGRLTVSDGHVVYEGQFNDGLPAGEGTVKWPDQSWYYGEFQRGLRDGRGLHVSAEDGRRWYGGRWTRGKRNGSGETGCCGDGCGGRSDGALDYAGDWVDGQPQGHGTGSWPDGSRYTGQWVDGRPHGYGKAVWPSDDVYDGDWVDGLMEGTGTYEWKSNPRDYDRLVLCSCDRYTGQWSKSKKHGKGVFYSAETGSTVCGRWVDDELDGPCEILLSNGQRLASAGLVFRRNVLYEVPAPPSPATPATTPTQAATPKAVGRGGRRIPVPTGRQRIPVPTGRQRLPAPNGGQLPALTGGQLPMPSVGSVSRRPIVDHTTPMAEEFRQPCEPRLPVGAVQKPVDEGPRLVRANVRLSAAYDLAGHVRRAVTRCSEKFAFGLDNAASAVTVDFELELAAAEQALHAYADRLTDLYCGYGSFLAGGPVAYPTLMTRLGLWKMLVDSGLHGQMAPADFDDLLYENENYAFGSAHDPFEPIYYWQFVHVVCELATVVYDARRTRPDDYSRPPSGSSLMAEALHELFANHLKPDVVPVSYGVEEDGETWMNSRKTITMMYEVYRTMAKTGGDAEESLPTARRLIRIYGPTLGSGSEPCLGSVLPVVLDTVFDSRDEQMELCAVSAASGGPVILFECTVESVVALLSEACPRIVDRRGVLVNVDTRLTFGEWYRFVMLCVRDCRRIPRADHDELFLTEE